MLGRLIDFHLRHKFVVLLGLIVLIAAGLRAVIGISVDAFPDLTNNQVVVITESPSMAPAEIESLITYPIETALMGLPRTQEVRSISKLGLSLVTVVFDDDVSTYFARQLVAERLLEARERLPQGVDPHLGPVATAFGEIYQYTVEGAGRSPMELKTLHEWQVKNQLRAIPGVNEVNTWGGETRQIHVVADPAALSSYGLTLRDIFERLRDNNENFGGGFIEYGSEQYTVRGIGLARGAADIGNIVIHAHSGTPVLLRQVATVADGPMPRQGAVTRDGRGESVSGMVIMLKGENGKTVIERVKARLASITLPPGVRIVPFYDQSAVIESTIATVRRNLLEGGLLVVAVLLIFLGNLRAALIVAAVIPLAMLTGFIGMRMYGVSANLMSLGAIDFGMIVDGAVVMVENAVRRRREGGTVREAAHEVARPIAFGVAIIIAVYLPIFFLEGLEGRMFRPMAVTVCAALAGSLMLALFVVPAVASMALRGEVKEYGEHWFHRLRDRYETALAGCVRRPALTIAIAAIVVAVPAASLAFIGTEFMPRLDEGSILIESRKLPGISLTESVAMSQKVETILRAFPEVSGVVTKIGRPDLATEAMGIHQGDIYVLLHPAARWRFATKAQLIDELAKALEPVPGVAFSFTQPMAMRLDETVSGVKADVALKIFGEDATVLERLAEQSAKVLRSVRGSADVQVEVVSGVAELRVEPDRAALARYGLNISDLREITEAVSGGIHASELIDGPRRFDIVVRLPDESRADPSRIASLLLTAPGGERVPLRAVAGVTVARGPELISREQAQRRVVAQANVRGRDLGSFVAEARPKLAAEVVLPPGYHVEWGGQFENQERATRRLLVMIPLTIAIIFGILYATFSSIRQALLILINVPLALAGGVGALWLRGLNLNLSASVGFIALFGVAVLNGIVLVSSINRLRQDGLPMDRAVLSGAGNRLRPVLMTALVASLGFLPMAVATSAGAEVQRPLATVVIGGLVTSTLLTLFLLPVLYPKFTSASESPAASSSLG